MFKMFKKMNRALLALCVLSTMQLTAQCGRDLCTPFDDCECNRIWLDAEYLSWQIEHSPRVIPLAITGSTRVPILGQGDATVVLGDRKINNDWRSGGKFTVGYWFDDECCFGPEASYFFLPSDSKRRSIHSTGLIGSPTYAFPFFDVITNSEASTLISNPVASQFAFLGTASYRLRNEMQGAELNAWLICYDECDWTVGALAGFRYWNFDEQFHFQTSSPYLVPNTDIFSTSDKFDVENNFYGGQIGTSMSYACDCFFFDVKAKLALGVTQGKVRIHGHFRTNEFNIPLGTGDPITIAGGYLALPTNIGDHKKNFFTCIPEINLNLGYQILDCVRLKVGYTYLGVSKVLRATRQVSRCINPTQAAAIVYTPEVPMLEGKASPRSTKKTQSLWVQGVNVGLDFSF